MALSRVKTWIKETLTFADLNAEFNNILNNATSLISPATGNWDMDGNTLILDSDGDSSIRCPIDDQIAFRVGGTDTYYMDASIFDLNAKRLDLDDDNDTSIRAATDDTITIEIGGSDLITMTATQIDINGLELVLDADADSTIHMDSDDQLDMRLQGIDAFIFNGAAVSAVNGLTFASSATGVDVTINAHGDDTNIDIGLVPKGSGNVAVTNGITVDSGLLTGAVINGSTAWNTPNIANGAYGSTTVTVTGVTAGDFLIGSVSGTMTAGMLISAVYDSANTARVVVKNDSGITWNPASNTAYVRVLART